MIKRFYPNEESELYKSLNGESLRLAALKSWVLKEASIKCLNGGISKDLSKLIIKDNYNKSLHRERNIELNTFYFDYKSWSIGIAYKSINGNSKGSSS